MKRPPKIQHVNFAQSDDRQFLVDRIVDNFRLKEEEAKLLRFYSMQSSGMAPSKKLLSKNGVSNAARARAKLAHDGIIRITFNDIVLDWNVLRILASLDKSKIGKFTYATNFDPIEMEQKLKELAIWSDLMIPVPQNPVYEKDFALRVQKDTNYARSIILPDYTSL